MNQFHKLIVSLGIKIPLTLKWTKNDKKVSPDVIIKNLK